MVMPLLLLGFQTIQQQRKILSVERESRSPCVAFEGRHLIVGHQAEIEQQPANQGGFAGIDAAASHDADDLAIPCRACWIASHSVLFHQK